MQIQVQRKNQNYCNIIHNPSNQVFTCSLKQPPIKEIRINLGDGEEAVFKDCSSLQEFLDKVQQYHKLEKALSILKSKINKALDFERFANSGTKLYEGTNIVAMDMAIVLEDGLNEIEDIE